MIGQEGVLTRTESRVGVLTLNRPRALNALTVEMCRAMLGALAAWRDEAGVSAVLIDHAGPRGFCAGGDVRRVLEEGRAGAAAFFAAEYKLNALIHSYPKPVVAIMDGVTMGGGVGLSVHGRYRVATERTVWAMPETSLGLFPDVGGGWFLPRLRGRLGAYLALTGARLGAADLIFAGLATHVIAADRIARLKHAMFAAGDEKQLEALLDTHHADPGPSALAPRMPDIDRLFASDTAEDICAALEADGGGWALSQLSLLRAKSPQTVKVALRQLQMGARMQSFVDNMRMEYGLAMRITARPDFREGVRAVLIDKDNAPHWRPATLEGVTGDMLEEIFAPLPDDEALRL